MSKTTTFGTYFGAMCGVLAMVISITVGCEDTPPEVKNRVPTVPAQLEQASQAVKDAQAAADRAEAANKSIREAVAKLDGRGLNSDGSWRVGQPQVSGIGNVTEVGETKQHIGENDTRYIFSFTFAERAGFVKTFTPVCPNQNIPVNATVILNFHWKPYEDGAPGCFMLDGHTVIK